MVRQLLVPALVVGWIGAGAGQAYSQSAPAGSQKKAAPVAGPRKAPAGKKRAPAAQEQPTPPAPEAVAAPAAPPAPTPPASDVRVVTAFTQGAQLSTNTTLIRGPRQRVEFPGVVSIDQCDLQRTVLLSPAAKRYRVQPYAEAGQPAADASTPSLGSAAAAPPVAPGTGAAAGRGGVITMATTLTDTLERQTMFGLEARRIKTVMTRQASPSACDKTSMRTEIDAWYVDLPKVAASCARPGTPPEPPPPADTCQDRVESRVTGDVTLGFPVKSVTTVATGEGDKQDLQRTSADVTALEVTRLDPSLFEVPSDYAEAKSLLELTPSVAAGGTLADALFGSTADGTNEAAPKPAGVVRIGVLEPANKSPRTSLSTRALRQELVTRLTKGSYEGLPLSGSSPDAIATNMAKLDLDYLLLAEVTEVKTSKPGKVGGLMKLASGAGPPKDRHEVKMAYRLYPAASTATAKASGEVKADNGGGFGVGSALKVASFAGQMYMGYGGMRMMRGLAGAGGLGMGMGMMNPMSSLASSGSIGAMGGAFYDPRSIAMTSIAASYASGLGGGLNLPGMPSADPADHEVFQVAVDAASDVAKAATDKLKTGK